MMQHCGAMQRRTLLQLGLGSAALLALAAGGLAPWQPGLVAGHLSATGRKVFHALARAVLDGSLHADAAARQAQLLAHLQRLDATVAGLPGASRTELSRLLALLGTPAGRIALAGLHTDWGEAGVAELQQALQTLRHSRLALRRQAYHALRDLTNAAFYADAATWPLLGYPGPRPL
jgi:hypothetical protein